MLQICPRTECMGDTCFAAGVTRNECAQKPAFSTYGECDGDGLVLRAVFIHILKQNREKDNKQSGKFTCVFRTDWQKNEKLAKMALQIPPVTTYNRNGKQQKASVQKGERT